MPVEAAPPKELCGEAAKTPCRAPLYLTEAEADALLAILLRAKPSDEADEERTQRLLCRVADLHRALRREEK